MAQVVNLSDYFATDDERDEITLKKGAHVWVRQTLSAEDRGRFQRSLMNLELDMATGQVQVKDLSWDQQAIKLCQAYIIDWDLPMPYSKDAVAKLKEDVLDEISRGIDRLQTEHKEAAEKKE